MKSQKIYTPPAIILERYAKVLVHFGLGGGKGIKKGETVWLRGYESSKPLYAAVYREIIRSGGNVIGSFATDVDEIANLGRDFYQLASPEQLNFFPAKFYRGLVDQTDHSIYLITETDMHAMEGVDPKKMMASGKVMKPYMDWRNEKESKGKFSWTLCLYGTPAMAAEAGMTQKEYWQQIIKACYLDQPDPVAKWRGVNQLLQGYIKRLDAMKIDKVHIKGPDADLWITIGKDRRWLGGRGANIPSFEIFTSPDWRGTNGWIKFNQPLYRYGNLIKNVRLEFKNGIVVKSFATKNEKLLKQMIATEGANKVGEFSMTDGRYSKITKFMAQTLFDENIGGPNGNTHIAVGMAYVDTYSKGAGKLTKKMRKELGFNDSSVHTDIISTAPRIVTAYLPNGKSKVIYKNGKYQF